MHLTHDAHVSNIVIVLTVVAVVGPRNESWHKAADELKKTLGSWRPQSKVNKAGCLDQTPFPDGWVPENSLICTLKQISVQTVLNQ